MLVSLQTSGTKPPLFLVHGIRGFAFALGSRFARLLGPDQPIYIIHANGLDGRGPALETVDDMVAAYSEEICKARPTGALRLGGMCAGCMVAVEIARRLQAEGRQTGPVLLVDPPILPAGFEKRQNTIDVAPEHAERFLQEVRTWFVKKMLDPDGDENLPFNPRDPKQLHTAAAVATRTTVAFKKCVPRPFDDAVHVIVSESRAAAFFHPQMPWHNLLAGPRIVHVVPWPHMELFQAGRQTVARLMKSVLEEDPAGNIPVARQMRPMPQSPL